MPDSKKTETTTKAHNNKGSNFLVSLITYHYKYSVSGFRETLVLSTGAARFDGSARKYWEELVFVVILHTPRILCVFIYLLIYGTVGLKQSEP